MERIKMKFEFITKKGMLSGIKVTTSEMIGSDKWEEHWIDSRYLQLLLNLDSEWRTLRRITKGFDMPTMAELHQFMRHLVNIGLVERRKRSNAHTEYKRKYDFPKHSLTS
tara:strand:- start:75 stop:404 length:330 start_codon:yes stop_codon:yes gene_type:complete